MNYKAIQDAVIADLLDETDRPTVQWAINARANLLWSMDEWTFRRNSALVTVTVGSNQVTGVPADFKLAVDLFRDDGFQLKMFEEYREFAGVYLGTDNLWTGPPEAMTVLGTSTILVGPTVQTTSSNYLLVYERGWTDLVMDTDVPALPTDTHPALVLGTKADMCILKMILLNEPLEQRYQEYLQGMQRDYITAVRGDQHQTPAYRPGGAYSGRWLEP